MRACRLSFVLGVICALSAVFHGVSLVLAGGLGQSCQPYGNFSELLRLVIDDNMTWRGNHLLGKAVLGNGSYPLTFRGVLESCQLNESLYNSLHLGNRFDLEECIYVSAEEKVLGELDKDILQLTCPL